MKIAVVFLGIIIIALCLPAIPDALFDFRTDSVTDTFVEATGAGVYNTSVQLSEPLWDGSIAYADVASNDTSEVPTAGAYNSTTRALLVTNLNASAGHILTVTYDSAGLADYSGAETGVRNIPTAIVAAIIILPLALIAGWFFKR